VREAEAPNLAPMPEPVKLALIEVRTAVPSGLGVEAGLIVLQEESAPYRILRIVIGQPEARAIQAARQGAVPGRPGTWDLFVTAVAMLDGAIDRVVITGVEQERHFYAALELTQQGQRRTISCRPSDAVALAVRAPAAGIYAARRVLDEAGRLHDGTKPAPPEPPPVPAPPVPPPPELPVPEPPAPDPPPA
jgi:bifunctional DNase/RNase